MSAAPIVENAPKIWTSGATASAKRSQVQSAVLSSSAIVSTPTPAMVEMTTQAAIPIRASWSSEPHVTRRSGTRSGTSVAAADAAASRSESRSSSEASRAALDERLSAASCR